MIACADDYGLSDDINEAILKLCQAKKLSAVSCMAVLERCTGKSLAELRRCEATVDIGLHFCLTDEGLPLSSPCSGARPRIFDSFGHLLRLALVGQVSAEEITSQVSTQYYLFSEKCGRRPDFIDGHLHVHQLPGVRKGLLDFILGLPSDCRPYVRNTRPSLWQLSRNRLPLFKAIAIGLFGTRIWKQLQATGLPTNDGFAGVYDFRNWREYPEFLPRFAACLDHPNGILVVHPGFKETWRRQEFKMLSEFAFPPGMPNRFQR
jgi:chitin disaccharide deacetylase